MSSLSNKLQELVSKQAGLTDREITDAIFDSQSPQQPVNIEARKLAEKGAIQRMKREDGLIGNYPLNAESSEPEFKANSDAQLQGDDTQKPKVISFNSNVSLQPKPDSKKYSDLISEIRKGQIKIPKFQRDFVWSLPDTAKLLDSILKGYPIGTFILWNTSERMNHIKNIGKFKLPEPEEGEKIQYILDGQQRITSLYAAYSGETIRKEGEKKVTDYKNIYIDLEKDIESDEQIVTDVEPEGLHISLHKVLNHLKFDDEIEDNYEDRNCRKRIRQYANIFETYDFSTIVLRKEDIDSAIEVFTRINTGGAKLSLFEIMSAKTYDEAVGFDMAKKFQELLKELELIRFDTISSSVILSSLSLVLSKNKECKRKVILQLDKQQIIDNWDKVVSALRSSIDYFRSVYRIPVSTLLPYDALLIPFTYFFYYNERNPSGTQAKYLEEFFWRISLSHRYSSTTESRLSQDIKRIDKILEAERPSYDDITVYLDSAQDLVETNFSAGNSYCKAILCLLAYFEPKDFENNGKVILDNSWLKAANSRNYHHFFPKAYLRKEKIANENSVVNITFVGADLNKRKIGAKPPSNYVGEFLEENEKLPQTLKSHLIDDIESFGVLSDDYTSFLTNRAERIYTELKNRIELKHEVDSKEEELHELILKGESDKVEFKASLRYDYVENTLNKKLEYVIAKTISAFINTDGGELIIGIHDNGTILGLENDYKSFSKSNKDGFELHLINLIKKYLGEELASYIKISFPVIEDKEICRVKLTKRKKLVVIENEGKQDVFIRLGCSSQPLDRKKQSDYEDDR